MTDNEALDQVAAQYRSIHSQFTALLGACQTPAQRSALGNVIMDAHDNYVHAQRLFFEQNSAAVQTIGKAAEQTQKSVDQSLADLKNISKTLDDITSAVKIVTQVAAVFVQL